MNRRSFLRGIVSLVAGFLASSRTAAAFGKGKPAPSGGIPVGQCEYWMGHTLPPGFIWPEGQALSITEYPELFDVLGYTYGCGGVGEFRVPDVCRPAPVEMVSCTSGVMLPRAQVGVIMKAR